MTWTYSQNPSASDKDAIRFLVGDTKLDDQLIEDEEIAFTLTQEPGLYYAASAVCRSIAAEFARKVQKSVGALSLGAQQQYEHYMDLAAKYRSRAQMGAGRLYLGGLSVAEHVAEEQNTDDVQPFFRRGQWENVGAGSSQQDALVEIER